MKKLFLTIIVALVGMTMWANTYWYAGSSNGWASTAMNVSEQGTYEYIQIAQQSGTLQFKIQLGNGNWDGALDRFNTQAGFALTDITNMNSASAEWNENKNGNNSNCCIWYVDKAFYVIVFKPNTVVNTGTNPIICASTTLPEEVAPPKFCITGDSALVVDAGAGIDKKWSTTAIPSTEDSYTMSLKGGMYYRLKVVVNGEWKGYGDLTSTAIAAGLSQDHDGNICFTMAADGDVTVTYTESLFKLEGNFYVAPVEERIIKFVPNEEWLTADAKFAAWVWGDNLTSQWTSFFVPVSAGNDTLKTSVLSSADSIVFVRFSPKASEPTWEQAQNTDVLVWNEIKDAINWSSMTASVVGWDSVSWQAVEHACESFGLVIDGVYHAGKKNVLQSEWMEYVIRNVELKAGDSVQVRDDCHNANWAISQYATTSFEFPIANNKYVISGDGSYDFYLKLLPGGDEIYISKAGFYTNSVPSQCEDVMIQAFYNESYNDNAPGVSATADYKLGLGNTRWTTLTAQAEELAHSFDLIWLPPSANGDGMGYHPKNYSNQNSNWGTRAELEALISALHDGGAKVVADIVINHCQSTNGWLGFPEFDFGEYGKFQPTGAWVCKNDEVNTNPNAGSEMGKATGNYDDGENWDGARDWAHDMPEVQNMFKAYLQWMREVMHYDGFRYDKGDGFNNWHHDNYNKAAGPYIAFMECYSGTDEIQSRIAGANYNLMGLDFDTKWHVFNSFAGWDYSRGRGDGLLGRGDGRYAVEFIDSHDWFLRTDNENEFGGRGNSLTDVMKCRLLQANAFLLSMPGVPCVFYPHWAKYKEFIKPMIEARKLAGVHSESEVKDEYANSTGYQATVVGKDGYLILCLGDKAHQDFSQYGYQLKASYYETNDAGQSKDASYQIWVNRTTPLPTGMESVEGTKNRPEKFMQNGQLFIRKDNKVYSITGNRVL